MKLKTVALIPARSGSKRIPDKNIKLFNQHPLLAYTVCAAIESGVFDSVVCITDNKMYADIALHYGAEVPSLRPHNISGDKSPDIEWVVWALQMLNSKGHKFDIFSILRPTSPFRLPVTIKRAWNVFNGDHSVHSLRAVEKCSQHPGKMWVVRGERLLPILPFMNTDTPWHSSQYAALPEIYVQNASLEIAWTSVALEKNSIAGETIIPFVTKGLEGFDINSPEDWLLAEKHLSENKEHLLEIKQIPFS